MKQKYTLNIADIQLNVVADMEPEQVNKIAGILDRKMREFYLNSRHCTKNEAALLCALEFCSERLDMQTHTAELETLTAKYETVLRTLQERNQVLNDEVDKLKSENTLLRSLVTTKPAEEITAAEPATPISAADFFTEVAVATESAAPAESGAHQRSSADDVDSALANARAEAAARAETEGKDDAKRRTRRGSMFDLLSFDQD